MSRSLFNHADRANAISVTAAQLRMRQLRTVLMVVHFLSFPFSVTSPQPMNDLAAGS
jgi:hypothetical protein